MRLPAHATAAAAQVADPSAAQYGEFLTREQLAALTRPSAASVAAVRAFVDAEFGAAAAAAAVLSADGGWLTVRAPARLVERAFACELRVVAHAASGATLLRTQRYTVPRALAQHLDFVAGLVRVPRVAARRPEATSNTASATSAANVDGDAPPTKRQNIPWLGVTPRLLRERYNCSDAFPRAAANRQSIAQFLGQYYDTLDLEEFFALMFQELIGQTPTRVVGPNGWVPGVESNLDVQYIMGVSAGVDTWVFSTPDLHDGQEPFLVWLQNVANLTDAEVPKGVCVALFLHFLFVA